MVIAAPATKLNEHSAARNKLKLPTNHNCSTVPRRSKEAQGLRSKRPQRPATKRQTSEFQLHSLSRADSLVSIVENWERRLTLAPKYRAPASRELDAKLPWWEEAPKDFRPRAPALVDQHRCSMSWEVHEATNLRSAQHHWTNFDRSRWLGSSIPPCSLVNLFM